MLFARVNQGINQGNVKTHGDGPFVLRKLKRESHKWTVPVCIFVN